MPSPSGTDHGSMRAGSGVSAATSIATPKPNSVPSSPPTIDSVVDSVRTCQTMSRRLAPSALRRPISRVRSDTTISMMFMMTMPPTTSDRETTPIRMLKAPWENVFQRPTSVSDVYMPKLSFSRGRRWRFTRSATRAASIAGSTSSGRAGFTVSSSDRRDPNSR